jgi:hypothetical protein
VTQFSGLESQGMTAFRVCGAEVCKGKRQKLRVASIVWWMPDVTSDRDDSSTGSSPAQHPPPTLQGEDCCGNAASLATLLGWAGLARLRNTTKSHVVFEDKLAGVQGFRLEGRAVGRDESPMTNLAAQQVDETQ